MGSELNEEMRKVVAVGDRLVFPDFLVQLLSGQQTGFAIDSTLNLGV